MMKVEQELQENNNLEDIQGRLIAHFRTVYSETIQREHIFEALFLTLADRENLEWSGDIWHIDITYEEALRVLEKFDFNVLFNPMETSIDILPQDLIIQYKVRVKIKGLIWIIHRYDADPFPSNPHAHQINNNIKLDLSNGMCYRQRKLVYIVDKKTLIQIRGEASKVYKGNLPPLTV